MALGGHSRLSGSMTDAGDTGDIKLDLFQWAQANWTC
jgi:hypothetical protein